MSDKVRITGILVKHNLPHKLATIEVEGLRERIMQALTNAYCTEQNSHKIVDPFLIKASTDLIIQAIGAEEVKEERFGDICTKCSKERIMCSCIEKIENPDKVSKILDKINELVEAVNELRRK